MISKHVADPISSPTHICGAPANFRYTWPGRDEAMICLHCAARLQQIANAMGLYVQLIPISFSVKDPIPDPYPTCEQHVRERP